MTTLILLAMGVMGVRALSCLANAAQWRPAVALRQQAGLSRPRVK
jgi:hypothetical protein